MAATKYTYSISADFPSAAVTTPGLLQEVRDSAIVTAVDRIDTEGDACDVWFKDALSTADQAVLDALVAAHAGEALPEETQAVTLAGTSEDEEHRLRVSVEPRKTGSGKVFVSHNWCDPTSWWTESKRIEGETLDDSGDGLTFESDHVHWIDLTHGKIYREDLLSAPYLPIVKIDGVEATIRAPWATSGGDYEINYVTGEITFFISQTGKVITADYSYEDGSLFIIAPTAGKRLWVEYSEVQFSRDIDILATTMFQPWAYNPADLPNKAAAAAATTYKTLDNFIEEANGCYPEIPAMGGARGINSPRVTFPFKYATVKELCSDCGVEIHVWTEDDVPFGGEYGTVTFYCTSYDL